MSGVRLANIHDASAMSRIHARTWKAAYINYISPVYLDTIPDDGWIPLFERAFKESIHEAAVFVQNGIITGTVTYGKARAAMTCTAAESTGTAENNNGGRSFVCGEGEIISLYVLPEYWSTGQGFQLTEFAVDSLKNQGYKSCFLWVIKENERAVNFYKKFGFKSTGIFTSVVIAGQDIVEEKYILDF